MEWYKHSTGSHEDPDINELWDEFGDSGYVMFFIILEIYGKEYNALDSEGFLWLNLNYIARKCRKSSGKVKKFLRYCEEISRFSLKISNDSEKKIGIKIPKFINISSNWTTRKKAEPTEAPTETPTAKEVEVEEEEETTTCPLIKIVALFNLCVKEKNSVVGKVVKINPKTERHTLTKARWREYPEIEVWRKVFKNVAMSDFCNGKNDRSWKADYDWIIKSANFIKCLENKYCNKTKIETGVPRN